MEQIKHIRLDKLNPPDFDVRFSTNPEQDEELRESIRNLGILEPLLVRDTENGYEIIIGYRRYLAAGKVGLPAVPCIVVKANDSEADKMKIHENIKRLPMSHIDQGITFKHLISKYNMTESQVATLVQKSIAYVSQHLSLLESDPKLVDAVRDGRVNFSVARELMLLKDNDELHRLQNICENDGAGAKIVHNWVQESNRETENTPPVNSHHEPNPNIQQYTQPTYPCMACEGITQINFLKIARLCPECFEMIFKAIDDEKKKIAEKTAIESSEHA